MALISHGTNSVISLGRRFRSLKLCFVLCSYGISGLRHLLNGITLAEKLGKLLRQKQGLFTVFTAARKFYLTSTVTDGRFAIRVCTGGAAVREEYIHELFDVLVAETKKLVDEGEP
ncbi:uncharacterized protein K441DRAFT_699332 [Cenococcum geophilum 1.58]|uniref:uncharacterized protein n=1 Tax=Cenococcum geophilum 1.58 TaxID=794803 RepID=UPI00358DF2A5|nr:hypothetical protein K441DRAFT_699332 [Cenococcum geophilum 1.58]